MLGLLEVAVGTSATHGTRVVLGSVLGGVICRITSHGHHTDVLHEVLLAHEVTHVVFVSNVFLIIRLLLLDLGDLRLGQVCDVAQYVHNASVLRLDLQALQLVLQLDSHAFRPPTDLVIDQLHILLALVQALKLDRQILFFSLQMSILALLGLSVILRVHQHLHLCIIGIFLLLIVLRWFADLTPVFVGYLQFTHFFCFCTIELFQLVVSLLICLDGEEKLGVGLLLSHELLDDLPDVGIVRLIPDLLETFLDVSVVGHFSAHSLFEVG